MIYFELIVKLYKKTKVNIKLHDTKLLWFISATILLGKITSQGRPEDVPKRRPMDVTIWSSMQCQGTSPTDVLRMLKYNVWGRPNVTSWGCPHTVLYVTPWYVPYRRLEDVSYRRYEDIPMLSNTYLQGACPSVVLRTSLREVLRTS